MEHGGEVLRTCRREHVVNFMGSLAVRDWNRLGHVGTCWDIATSEKEPGSVSLVNAKNIRPK